MPTRRRALLFLVLLLGLTALSLGVALLAGSQPLDLQQWKAVFQGQPSLTTEIILQLRLPRALTGFACGGLLALAGALMQILLRNPLADPYILGVSGGAGVGALSGMLLGLSALWVDALAFSGALGVILLVFGLARGEGSGAQTRLLLTGVIIASGCGALIALMLAIAPEAKLRGMLFWLMGDLSLPTLPWPPLLFLGLTLGLSLPFARELNLLSRGRESAQTLGVNVARICILIYFIAALATATAVSSAGSIGFVGLVVPHLVRLALGNDQRLLLPACVLTGGALLVAADTLARTLVAPQQLPVGVLTALIGVPLFLFLLSRQGKHKR